MSLVRREILLDLSDEHWYWQLRGYGPQHAESVERDAAVAMLFRDRSEQPGASNRRELPPPSSVSNKYTNDNQKRRHNER